MTRRGRIKNNKTARPWATAKLFPRPPACRIKRGGRHFHPPVHCLHTHKQTKKHKPRKQSDPFDPIESIEKQKKNKKKEKKKKTTGMSLTVTPPPGQDVNGALAAATRCAAVLASIKEMCRRSGNGGGLDGQVACFENLMMAYLREAQGLPPPELLEPGAPLPVPVSLPFVLVTAATTATTAVAVAVPTAP